MHPVVRKLSVFAQFNAEEERALALAFSRTFSVEAKHEVARQDEEALVSLFLLSGLACRHKIVDVGTRQLVALLIPGDACEIGVSLLARRDHGITAMSSATVARVSDAALQHLAGEYPRIGEALRWSSLVEQAIGREWIVNLAVRKADARMAHLFCEQFFRMDAIGLAQGQNFEFPVTQTDLADTLGLSSVHVNRTLQLLRAKGLIAFGDRRLTILDLPALSRVAGFHPGYLHLDARYENGAQQRSW